MLLECDVRLAIYQIDSEYIGNSFKLNASIFFKLPNEWFKTNIDTTLLSLSDHSWNRNKFLDECINLLNDEESIMAMIKTAVLNKLKSKYKLTDRDIKEAEVKNLMGKYNGKYTFKIDLLEGKIK